MKIVTYIYLLFILGYNIQCCNRGCSCKKNKNQPNNSSITNNKQGKKDDIEENKLDNKKKNEKCNKKLIKNKKEFTESKLNTDNNPKKDNINGNKPDNKEKNNNSTKSEDKKKSKKKILNQDNKIKPKNEAIKENNIANQKYKSNSYSKIIPKVETKDKGEKKEEKKEKEENILNNEIKQEEKKQENKKEEIKQKEKQEDKQNKTKENEKYKEEKKENNEEIKTEETDEKLNDSLKKMKENFLVLDSNAVKMYNTLEKIGSYVKDHFYEEEDTHITFNTLNNEINDIILLRNEIVIEIENLKNNKNENQKTNKKEQYSSINEKISKLSDKINSFNTPYDNFIKDFDTIKKKIDHIRKKIEILYLYYLENIFRNTFEYKFKNSDFAGAIKNNISLFHKDDKLIKKILDVGYGRNCYGIYDKFDEIKNNIKFINFKDLQEYYNNVKEIFIGDLKKLKKIHDDEKNFILKLHNDFTTYKKNNSLNIEVKMVEIETPTFIEIYIPEPTDEAEEYKKKIDEYINTINNNLKSIEKYIKEYYEKIITSIDEISYLGSIDGDHTLKNYKESIDKIFNDYYENQNKKDIYDLLKNVFNTFSNQINTIINKHYNMVIAINNIIKTHITEENYRVNFNVDYSTNFTLEPKNNNYKNFTEELKREEENIKNLNFVKKILGYKKKVNIFEYDLDFNEFTFRRSENFIYTLEWILSWSIESINELEEKLNTEIPKAFPELNKEINNIKNNLTGKTTMQKLNYLVTNKNFEEFKNKLKTSVYNEKILDKYNNLCEKIKKIFNNNKKYDQIKNKMNSHISESNKIKNRDSIFYYITDRKKFYSEFHNMILKAIGTDLNAICNKLNKEKENIEYCTFGISGDEKEKENIKKEKLINDENYKKFIKTINFMNNFYTENFLGEKIEDTYDIEVYENANLIDNYIDTINDKLLYIYNNLTNYLN